MIEKIIEQEKEKIIADMCRKIADREWIKTLISETPDTVKGTNPDDLKAKIDSEKDEEILSSLRKELSLYKRYEQDLIDLNVCERSLDSDVNSFKVLSNATEEITNLLK